MHCIWRMVALKKHCNKPTAKTGLGGIELLEWFDFKVIKIKWSPFPFFKKRIGWWSCLTAGMAMHSAYIESQTGHKCLEARGKWKGVILFVKCFFAHKTVAEQPRVVILLCFALFLSVWLQMPVLLCTDEYCINTFTQWISRYTLSRASSQACTVSLTAHNCLWIPISMNLLLDIMEQKNKKIQLMCVWHNPI